MFIRRAKPIRIIGDADNQCPDKWSATVFLILGMPSVCPVYPFLSDIKRKVYVINLTSCVFRFHDVVCFFTIYNQIFKGKLMKFR